MSMKKRNLSQQAQPSTTSIKSSLETAVAAEALAGMFALQQQKCTKSSMESLAQVCNTCSWAAAAAEKYENKKAQPEPAPQMIPQPITQLIEPKDGAAAILRVVGTAAGNA